MLRVNEVWLIGWILIFTRIARGQCNSYEIDYLRNGVNGVVPSPGNDRCESAVANADTGDFTDDDWCTCFHWPEAQKVVEDLDPDCRLSDRTQYTMKEALNMCDHSTTCAEATHEALCRSKNCNWDGSACKDNEQCFDDNAMVNQIAIDLEVPWVTDCYLLRAVMEYYHGKDCDGSLIEMNITSTTTLRNVCCETCHFADLDAPYVFDDNELMRVFTCTHHDNCTDAGTVDDYFCANCDQCDQNLDDCGICNITRYSGNACVPMQECTEEKSVDGYCRSRDLSDGTDPGNNSPGNRICEGKETRTNQLLEPCMEYYAHLDSHKYVMDYACDCFTHTEFKALDCVWERSDLFTLEQEVAFCRADDCNDIYSQDPCISSPSHCVWLSRLVKGRCVPDPCYDSDGNIEACEDTCHMCQTNELGEKSCVPNPEEYGSTCNDHKDYTNKDVCSAELGRCAGIATTEQIEEPKQVDGVCRDGEAYTCANDLMNATMYAEGFCTNATVNTYAFVMDGTCSNVITDDERAQKYFFSGTCVDGIGQRLTCNYSEYVQFLQDSSHEFKPIEDSAVSLSISIMVLLLCIFF